MTHQSLIKSKEDGVLILYFSSLSFEFSIIFPIFDTCAVSSFSYAELLVYSPLYTVYVVLVGSV